MKIIIKNIVRKIKVFFCCGFRKYETDVEKCKIQIIQQTARHFDQNCLRFPYKRGICFYLVSHNHKNVKKNSKFSWRKVAQVK